MPSAGDVTEARGVRRGLWLREVWASSIGKKVIVAITGLILATYLVLHVLGNLKALQGPGDGETAAIDTYAEWLRTVGEPAIPENGVLWMVRVVLVLALVLHVAGVLQLSRRNRAARGDAGRPARIQRTLASRTMMLTGLLLLAFVVFHILQFTTRTIQVTPVREGTVYANLYDAFQKWYFVAIYVAIGVAVLFHLRHSIWSVTQTAGWDKPNRNTTIRRFATGLAVFVGIGFAAVPVAFATGVLDAPEGASTPVAAAQEQP